MSEGYADLHLHTTASDGTQGISQLVKRAAAYGLSTIAITDHDTISQELTARVTHPQGRLCIRGQLMGDRYAHSHHLLRIA